MSVRVELPAHLRTLARVADEVTVDVAGAATVGTVLDALERDYPVLRGTIRDHVTHKRRPFIRFFACAEDLSLEHRGCSQCLYGSSLQTRPTRC